MVKTTILSPLEIEYCNNAVNNLVQYLEARKYQTMTSASMDYTNYKGKVYFRIPPEVYLRYPDAYDGIRYQSYIKETLKKIDVSLIFRSSTFEAPTKFDSYLWASSVKR